MLGLAAAFALGFLFGAGIMSLAYERNMIGVQRRSSNTRRISQLDVFELPPTLQADAKKTEARLSKPPSSK